MQKREWEIEYHPFRAVTHLLQHKGVCKIKGEFRWVRQGKTERWQIHSAVCSTLLPPFQKQFNTGEKGHSGRAPDNSERRGKLVNYAWEPPTALKCFFLSVPKAPKRPQECVAGLGGGSIPFNSMQASTEQEACSHRHRHLTWLDMCHFSGALIWEIWAEGDSDFSGGQESAAERSRCTTELIDTAGIVRAIPFRYEMHSLHDSRAVT